MNLDYSEEGKVKFNMRKYIEELIHDFPQKIKGNAKTLWTEKLFTSKKSNEILEKEQMELFHTNVMKMLFLCKREQPDISIAVVYLSSRVKYPVEEDWGKLIKVLSYWNTTNNDLLTLEADNDQIIQWHIDTLYASTSISNCFKMLPT